MNKHTANSEDSARQVSVAQWTTLGQYRRQRMTSVSSAMNEHSANTEDSAFIRRTPFNATTSGCRYGGAYNTDTGNWQFPAQNVSSRISSRDQRCFNDRECIHHQLSTCHEYIIHNKRVESANSTIGRIGIRQTSAAR